MKIIKLISLFVLISILGVSCTNSLSPDTKNANTTRLNSNERSTNEGVIAQDTLFTIIPNLTNDKQENPYLVNLRNNPATEKLYIARLNKSVISQTFQKGDVLAIPVSPGEVFVVKGKRVTKRKNGYTSWFGLFQNTIGSATLVIGKYGVTGTLSTDTARYQFEPIGGGLQAITKLNPEKFPRSDNSGNDH